MISLRYGLHPYLPSRLAFERLLRLTFPELGTLIINTADYSITPNRARVAIYREAAEVMEDTELMLIPKEDSVQLITHDINIAKQFIKIITQNLMEKEEDLLNFAYNSLRKKVAYGLIQLFDKTTVDDKSQKKSLDLTRKTMAHTIGVATESLIRTLADFRDEKLIDFEDGKVVLVNEKKLRNLPY